MVASRSMKAFLLRTAFIFSSIGFVMIYLGASGSYETALRKSSMDMARSLAEGTFSSMYKVMSKGWSRADLEDFVSGLQDASLRQHYSIDIYRGHKVTELYGEVDHPAYPDPFINNTFTKKTPQVHENGDSFRYSYPLVAEQKCLACHTNVTVGDVLGVIEVEQNLEVLLRDAKSSLLMSLLWMAPFPFVLAFLVVRLMNRRINDSVELLEEKIEGISTVSDLSLLDFQSGDAGFEELNKVLGKIETLSEKLKSIAVDRDLLEFEIRLLEKFVITSEVVKDWREYVATLLVDINQVVHAYNVFSVFKIDDELFDLEIFWINPPSESTRIQLEKMIRRKLKEVESFGGIASLEIHHNVANTDGEEVDLEHDEIELQTKSLFVDTPKIGGIVGIGVNSGVTQDKTRLLVMEGILSTLLNVVGSVKAIYKYTRDLEYYAARDPLTDLYNQRIFWELLGYELGRGDRHDTKTSLMLLDLDNFKSINDSYGHGVGDEYLQAFADAVHSSLRAGDILSRYGGDEFVVILPEADLEQACSVSERIIQRLSQLEVTTPSGEAIKATASIGVGVYPDHASNAKDLFMFVDNLMYKAKSEGKNCVHIPTEDDVVEVFRDISDKSRIVSQAIEERRVVPFFQPIMTTADGEIGAVEVLSRIEREDGTLMGAHEFIPVAESMGIIHNLDYIAIEKAFEAVNREGFKGMIFINLSPRSLVIKDFVHRIKMMIQKAEIEPERVVFEITERDTVKNLSMLAKFVTNLKSEGFQLAVDDFGSGFSSFHYLKHFPIDYVKIEGEFVVNMIHNEKDHAVVRCISGLANDLGAKTIAEFVESEEVLDAVKRVGIHYAQGYHIARPGPSIYPQGKPGAQG